MNIHPYQLLNLRMDGTEKDQSIKENTGSQNIVKELKQCQKQWVQQYREWTQTEYQNKHCNTDRKEEGT
jgi:hypothetical protein